jgi:hypothetical protein
MDRVFVGAALNDCSWSLDVLAQSEYRMSSHCRVSYALLDTAFGFVGVVLDLNELAPRRKDARCHGRCRFKDFVVTDAGESSPDLLVPFQTSGIHADSALDDCIQYSVRMIELLEPTIQDDSKIDATIRCVSEEPKSVGS